jgi:YXWGXW repeat-containing protein
LRPRNYGCGLLALAVSSASLTACVATVEERPPRIVYVAGPPPPPLSEQQGAAPAPGMLWVEGYWHWNGVQYVWIPGHWETPPPGYVWLGPSYTVVDGRHVYRAGHWSARSRVEPR